MTDGEQAHYVRCLKCSKILKCPVFDASCLLDHIRRDHPEIRIDEKSKITRPVTPKPILNKTKSDTQFKPSGKHKGGHKDTKTTEDEIETLAQQTGISSKKINTMAGFAGITKDELASAARKLSELSSNKPSSGKKDDESSVIYKRRYVMETQDTKHTTHSKCRLQRYTSSLKTWCCNDGVIYCPHCANVRRPLRKTRAEIISPCCAPCILRFWPFCIFPCASLNDQCEYLYCCSCKTFLGLYNPETNSIRPNKNFVEQETQNKCCTD